MSEYRFMNQLIEKEHIPTPAYVFDLDKMKEFAEKVKRCLTGKAEICYAMKANPFLIKPMLEIVSSLEVCSPGEFRICERAGIPMEKIVLSGVYKNPDDMRFDCYFLGGVDKFTISGNVISGVDENGKEVFSHTYSPFENKEDTGFLYYKTDDEDAGQFTYFAFAPDTPESTYHIEFRYAESVDDLQSWFEGSYAYWNAAGILEGYSDEMMDQCIELFATENLSGE